MKLKSFIKKFKSKKFVFIFTLLFFSSSAMAWFNLSRYWWGKDIDSGALIEARDINEMACLLLFMCRHECNYTWNQVRGCWEYYSEGGKNYKTITANNWASPTTNCDGCFTPCDGSTCGCVGSDCQTSGPVNAGDSITAEDINRIVATIKDRAVGWCLNNDPIIAGLTFAQKGDLVTAEYFNDVRDAINVLNTEGFQCGGATPPPTCKSFNSTTVDCDWREKQAKECIHPDCLCVFDTNAFGPAPGCPSSPDTACHSKCVCCKPQSGVCCGAKDDYSTNCTAAGQSNGCVECDDKFYATQDSNPSSMPYSGFEYHVNTMHNNLHEGECNNDSWYSYNILCKEEYGTAPYSSKWVDDESCYYGKCPCDCNSCPELTNYPW